jgi:hypothetical protein
MEIKLSRRNLRYAEQQPLEFSPRELLKVDSIGPLFEKRK